MTLIHNVETCAQYMVDYLSKQTDKKYQIIKVFEVDRESDQDKVLINVGGENIDKLKICVYGKNDAHGIYNIIPGVMNISTVVKNQGTGKIIIDDIQKSLSSIMNDNLLGCDAILHNLFANDVLDGAKRFWTKEKFGSDITFSHVLKSEGPLIVEKSWQYKKDLGK